MNININFEDKEEKKRRKRERTVILVIIALVIALTSFLVYITGLKGEALLPQNILVFSLINVTSAANFSCCKKCRKAVF